MNPEREGQNSQEMFHKKIALEIKNSVESQSGNNLAEKDRKNRW